MILIHAMLDFLPAELIIMICGFIPGRDVISLAQTNRLFNTLITNSKLHFNLVMIAESNKLRHMITESLKNMRSEMLDNLREMNNFFKEINGRLDDMVNRLDKLYN